MVAMSGGVDSSVAAMLLQQQGYDLIGVTMQVTDQPAMKENAGKTDEQAVMEAREIAERLRIPHYAFDLRQEFRHEIIEYFKNEYLNGRTPNPCTLCNPLIKWNALWEKAAFEGVDYLATGHYAQVENANGRYFLSRAKDLSKDQSYMLWGLSQQNIARTILPLGKYTKNEIKQMAKMFGFHELSEKKESFEICFVPNDDYRGFLRSEVPEIDERIGPGDIVNSQGEFLGQHRGFPFYTIGQRRGLGIALGEPAYVKKIDAENNRIVVGRRDELKSKGMFVENFNPVKHNIPEAGMRLLVKVRYHHPGVMANVKKKNEQLEITFDDPVSAVTPGQSAVFYDEDHLAGGGIIKETF